MAQVFSWKVAPGKYSYLIKDTATNSYIRNKITDTEVLRTMANTVASWSESKYASAYDEMKQEVNSTFGGGTLVDPYSKYFDVSATEDGKLVLLAGNDGDDGEGGTSGGGSNILGPGDYEALSNTLEKEFNKYREIISAQVISLKETIAEAASADISEAISRINATKDELAEIRQHLQEAAQSAREALEKANNIFDLDDSEITPEMLRDAVETIDHFQTWMTDYGDTLKSVVTDYDRARGMIGEIAEGEDVARGLLTIICGNINTISGTVGSVSNTLDASLGRIEQMATWYDDNASAMTEITRVIAGNEAAIADVVKFYNGDQTTQLGRYMCGMTGVIVDRAISEADDGVDTTELVRKMNAVEGVISDEAIRLNGVSGDLVTMRREMNAMSAQMVTSMTIAEDDLQAVRDFREVWSRSSGAVTTVSSLLIKNDNYGDPIYWYIGNGNDGYSRENPLRVYYQGIDTSANNKMYFTPNKNGSGQRYYDNVYPDYFVTMMSAIIQDVDQISMTVTSGDIISALRLSVEPGEGGAESRIYMNADRVVIDSQVWADSILGNAANIGGVYIGSGMVSAMTDNNKWALRGDGVLEATGAKIKGAISATSLWLGADADIGGIDGKIDAAIEEYLDEHPDAITVDLGDYVMYDKKISGETGHQWVQISKNGLLQANNAIISGTVYATNGYFKGDLSANSIYATNLKVYENGDVRMENGDLVDCNFKGSISATNGFFRGIITGSSIRGSDIQITIDDDNITDDVYVYLVADGSMARFAISRSLDQEISIVAFSGTNYPFIGAVIAQGNTLSEPIHLCKQYTTYGGVTFDGEIFNVNTHTNAISKFGFTKLYAPYGPTRHYTVKEPYEGCDCNFYSQAKSKNDGTFNFTATYEDGILFSVERTGNGFFVNPFGDVYAGNIYADTGVFNGYVRLKYVPVSEIGVNSGDIIRLDDRAYVYFDLYHNLTNYTMVLPNVSDMPKGFVYDIMIPPNYLGTRMYRGQCYLKCDDNSTIGCCISPVYISGQKALIGPGKYQIMLLPDEYLPRWIIVSSTGPVEMFETEESTNMSSKISPICSVVSGGTNGGISISTITGYRTEKPPKVGYDYYNYRMLIKSGATIEFVE